jgi:hypothetical protein
MLSERNSLKELQGRGRRPPQNGKLEHAECLIVHAVEEQGLPLGLALEGHAAAQQQTDIAFVDREAPLAVVTKELLIQAALPVARPILITQHMKAVFLIVQRGIHELRDDMGVPQLGIFSA